jgi:tRNA A37 threonylcarbamoyladenosine synthetase subunit TsaC/SUA5/YrdC
VFTGSVDFGVDDGKTYGSIPSTIVDVTGSVPRIVRLGVIPEETILRVWRDYGTI